MSHCPRHYCGCAVVRMGELRYRTFIRYRNPIFKVVIIDSSNPNNLISQFAVCNSHVLCTASIPGKLPKKNLHLIFFSGVQSTDTPSLDSASLCHPGGDTKEKDTVVPSSVFEECPTAGQSVWTKCTVAQDANGVVVVTPEEGG